MLLARLGLYCFVVDDHAVEVFDAVDSADVVDDVDVEVDDDAGD